MQCTAIQSEQRHHLNSAFKGKDAIIFARRGPRRNFILYFYLPSLDRFFFPFWNLRNRNVTIFWHFSTQKSELFQLNRNTWLVCYWGEAKGKKRTFDTCPYKSFHWIMLYDYAMKPAPHSYMRRHVNKPFLGVGLTICQVVAGSSVAFSLLLSQSKHLQNSWK